MKMSFKNRIATYQILVSSSLIALVFILVYAIVHRTVYDNIDAALSIEAYKHTDEVLILPDSIYFENKGEWEEREHREAQVLPVFIQLVNADGELMDKSPNLKDQTLLYDITYEAGYHFDGWLNGEALRQIQIPLFDETAEVKGYIVAAMSMQASVLVLRNLAWVELISFPIVVLLLFWMSRYLADKSIAPIKEITQVAKHTSRHFLDSRVPLPDSRDELYDLSISINSLLDRIQHAFQGEKQFTSQASHELRTPLATLRGSLEVLIRKSRQQEEYETTIKSALAQIDRMAVLSDQLLTLARMDSDAVTPHSRPVGIILEEVISELYPPLQEKQMQVDVQLNDCEAYEIPDYFSILIIRNLLANAIKYAPSQSTVFVHLRQVEKGLELVVADQGPGISAEDQGKIFQAFFRASAQRQGQTPGSGLGLSIVQKAVSAIGGSIKVESELGQGSRFIVNL